MNIREYLFVSESVDDWVDTTVEEHHDDCEIVESAREVDLVAEVVE